MLNKPAKSIAVAPLFNTIFTPSFCCVCERAVNARLSGAVGPSGQSDRPVYGISYYGIPNFVQALCLTGYQPKVLFFVKGLALMRVP
jgi:hypothetical protein